MPAENQGTFEKSSVPLNVGPSLLWAFGVTTHPSVGRLMKVLSLSPPPLGSIYLEPTALAFSQIVLPLPALAPRLPRGLPPRPLLPYSLLLAPGSMSLCLSCGRSSFLCLLPNFSLQPPGFTGCLHTHDARTPTSSSHASRARREHSAIESLSPLESHGAPQI